MGEYWKPTAEMFSSLFTNPKMTKKHLMRPPFKYILHIFMKTMQVQQGFCDGLYKDEEMEFSYYQKDKIQKLVFLQKMMDVVQAMTGENYHLNPKSIAAGKECDKTNAFLQGVYKASTSGVDSTPYVKQVLNQLEGGGGEKWKESAAGLGPTLGGLSSRVSLPRLQLLERVIQRTVLSTLSTDTRSLCRNALCLFA